MTGLADSLAAPPLPEDALRLHPDIMARLDFRAIFGNDQPTEVELGSGDGSFLAEYASRHANRNFLGVERLLGRMRKLDRKGRRRGLANLRCVRIEAAYVLEWMISPASITALHVYFPDPWPKRRHLKRRLINESFARHAHDALIPGGHVYLRTDHAEYFQQMNEVFQANSGFAPASAPPDLLEVRTDFERDFNARGYPTFQAAFARRPEEAH